MLAKKIFALAGLALAFLLIGRVSLLAQSKKSALYAEPQRLMLKGDEKEDEEAESGSSLREHFYPIGWSRDGKFAFYVEPPDEACGCYFGHLVIQDLRSDKILWEKKYTGSEEKEESIQTYWKQNQKEFSRKLAEYGIVAQPQFSLLDSAFTYQKDEFTPALTDTTTTDDGFYVTGAVVLRLLSKQKGGKTVYEKKFDPKKMEGFLGAELSGSLLSPFEPRAVVILIETIRGWEGLPHVTRIRVVGATLTNGFQ